MSRHRDVRNLDLEDYAYDDVFGRSVDDDYYMSPSQREFLYNREISSRSSEGDIKEESEAESPDIDEAKLESCIDQIKELLGTINISRDDLINVIVQNDFDIEKTTDMVLRNPKFTQAGITKAKDDTRQHKQFIIPKLNGLRNISQNHENKKSFIIPNIFNKNQSVPKSSRFIIPKLNFSSNKPSSSESKTSSELVAGQLETSSDISGIRSLTTRVSEVKLQDPAKDNNISPTINNLHPSEVKSLSSLQNSSSANEWQIDLSTALKTKKSSPILTKAQSLEKETFEMPFIECDQQSYVKSKETLKCTFNAGNLASIHFDKEKKKSNLGKVLSKKYKRSVIKLKRNSLLFVKEIKRFEFNTPSPDNIITKHLNR